jgi:hypothetical protein
VGQHKTRESSADRRIVDEAHTHLIERLAVLKPYRILYIADAETSRNAPNIFNRSLAQCSTMSAPS